MFAGPKDRRLLIIGDSAFAEVAYECFRHDSRYDVVGFAVERAYLARTELFGLPVFPLEEVEQHVSPGDTWFYAALVYTQLNRLRQRLYEVAKSKGYQPASYISSRAFVWPNVTCGEHCFIFEDNTIQPFVSIGSNVVLWSGNHIGHHSRIDDHVFIASHAVVSGFCRIGSHSFVGVNATISNNVDIAPDNWIGLGATIARNTAAGALYKGPRSEASERSALDQFGVR
jgi:sugar O-acyltransferase (sialic acid O-acetyltransferase NeuD family)